MQRLATLHSPLGKDLLFYQMKANERLSQVPDFTVDMLSEKPDIDFAKLLGQHMSVEMTLPKGSGEDDKRFFDGIVASMAYVGMQGRYFQYQAVVQPWLAFLDNTQDYKIFQDKAVVQILKEVFADAPGAKFEFKTTGSYTSWPYCVQYSESDLNFALRMLEQEGISYYFAHKKGEHTLVLTDSPSSHEAFPGYEAISYAGPNQSRRKDQEHVSRWQRVEQVRTGKVVITDYDFTRPSVSLLQNRSEARPHSLADMEWFEYPGQFDKEADGEQFVRNQMEAHRVLTQQAGGASDARGLACGRTFTLQGFTRPQENIGYLVTGTSIVLIQAGYEGADGDSGSSYNCEFTAVDAKVQFRPQRGTTTKPRVAGPQTAVIVGPAGDEIHTDKYGRVKVHFHWDRYGKKDGNDTCWVRVSQPWAGKNFGFQAIPRIGQEVIVDFLEGDPDQPIITGRVYNAEQMTPWELPANKTQTGVLTRSSSGGHYETANAIRFEDKKGAEQLWLRAEKDQLTEVEHDEDKWVGNDRRKTIDGHETTVVHKNRTETVDQNETITVHQNRTEEVDLDEKITIHKNRTERVDLDEKISIGMNRSEDVGVNENVTIGSNQTISIGANKTQTVAMMYTQNVGAVKMTNVGAAYLINVGAAMNRVVVGVSAEEVGLNKTTLVAMGQSVKVGKDQATEIGANHSLDVGKNIAITAGDSITLTCGKSVLKLDKDGNVTLNGHQLAVGMTGEQFFKADGDIVMKGKNIKKN
jgi:type VI secretion system secreted protein VgrG